MTANKIIIDIQDIQRYRRLARDSAVDFLVSYLFLILRKKGKLHPIFYPAIYTPNERKKVLDIAEKITSKISFNEGIDNGVKAYTNYIEYARSPSKEYLYQKIDSKESLERFLESKTAAENQINLMREGKFSPNKLSEYYKRLCTKIISAEIIRQKIEQTYNRATKIFDGHEYKIGVDVILRHGKDTFKNLDKKLLFSASWQEKQLGENIANILVRLEIESSLPILVAAIKNPNFFPEFKTDLLTLPKDEIISETEHAKNELESWKNIIFPSSLTAASIPFIVFDPNFVSFSISSVALVHSFISFIKCWHEKKRFSQRPNYAKFLALAITHDPRKQIDWWIESLRSMFRVPKEEDISWLYSQRVMGSWTDSSIYVPWFEEINP